MRTLDAVSAYLTQCRYRGLSPKTIVSYRWALRKLLVRHGTPPTHREELLELIADPALGPTSRRDLWRMLRTFYRWLYPEGKRRRNPMDAVPPPRVPRILPRVLEDGEISRLLHATHSRRDRAMVALTLDTGVRVGELAGLRWAHVKSKVIQVSGKTGPRLVPTSSQVRQLLVGLGDTEHIWTGRQGPLTRSGVEQVIRRCMAAAGFRPPKAGAHTLRHTMGRSYIMNGGDVFSLQRILGHRDVSTTMLYVHLSTRDLEEQHARYSPVANIELLTPEMDLEIAEFEVVR